MWFRLKPQNLFSILATHPALATAGYHFTPLLSVPCSAARTDGLTVLPSLCLPGLAATDSESQFSSHGSMRLSDSGSADDVEEYEIRGKRQWLC